jgi:hypothetical protein
LWGLASSLIIDLITLMEFCEEINRNLQLLVQWRSYYIVSYACCRFWTRWSGELRVQEVIHNVNLYWISNLYW